MHGSLPVQVTEQVFQGAKQPLEFHFVLDRRRHAGDVYGIVAQAHLGLFQALRQARIAPEHPPNHAVAIDDIAAKDLFHGRIESDRLQTFQGQFDLSDGCFHAPHHRTTGCLLLLVASRDARHDERQDDQPDHDQRQQQLFGKHLGTRTSVAA